MRCDSEGIGNAVVKRKSAVVMQVVRALGRTCQLIVLVSENACLNSVGHICAAVYVSHDLVTVCAVIE